MATVSEFVIPTRSRTRRSPRSTCGNKDTYEAKATSCRKLDEEVRAALEKMALTDHAHAERAAYRA